MFALTLLSEAGAEGPDTTLSWILYSGLGFLFLMIVIGWLTSLRKQDQPEARIQQSDVVSHADPVASSPKGETLSKGRNIRNEPTKPRSKKEG